jgi:ATP-dependent RNA helicase DeaD
VTETEGERDEGGGPEGTEVGFAELGLGQEVLSVLDALGYEEPTPIQIQAVPPLLAGRDVIGRAATGTGKTAAFALPLVERIDTAAPGVQGLVMAPTRELAVQVAQALDRYGGGRRLRVLAVYGGQPIERQLRELKRGVHVVVGTPGRLLDHLRRGSLDLTTVRYVVLDEADEMLDMGFIEDIETLLEATPPERQTALFSATIPPRIADLARRHLRDPERVTVVPEAMDTPLVRQRSYVVPRAHKLEALGRVLDLEAPPAAIVFCRTRVEVDQLTEALRVRGYRPEALHGGLAQPQRDRVMARFREGAADLLIATDVAARGLDVEHVTHVVNYDIPQTPDVYVHRIGRTGRAGREGVAITLVEPRERFHLRGIERVTGQAMEQARVPTISDLRERRHETLRSAIREMLLGEGLEPFRQMVASLAEDHDPLDVAAAAARLAAEVTQGDTLEGPDEIPQWEAPRGRDRVGGAEGRGPRGRRDREERGGGRGRGGDAARTTLYLGIGRRRGVRPADVVGAIIGEANVPASAVGAVEIADQFTLVEVDESVAERVIRALSGAAIRGRSVPVRRSREDRGPAEGGRGRGPTRPRD